jgi:hypothetical protein
MQCETIHAENQVELPIFMIRCEQTIIVHWCKQARSGITAAEVYHLHFVARFCAGREQSSRDNPLADLAPDLRAGILCSRLGDYGARRRGRTQSLTFPDAPLVFTSTGLLRTWRVGPLSRAPKRRWLVIRVPSLIWNATRSLTDR